MIGAADHFGLVSRLQDKVFGLGKVVRSLFFWCFQKGKDWSQ